MRKLCLAAVAAWVPGSGMACTVMTEFRVADLAGADLVFVGEVTDYEDLGTPMGAALVTVRVEEALKGKARGELVLIWNGGLATGPDAALATGRVLIGALRGGRIAVTDMVPDARPDLPKIIHPTCGEAWLVAADGSVLDEARALLD